MVICKQKMSFMHYSFVHKSGAPRVTSARQTPPSLTATTVRVTLVVVPLTVKNAIFFFFVSSTNRLGKGDSRVTCVLIDEVRDHILTL
jgi:hypothetical protein